MQDDELLIEDELGANPEVESFEFETGEDLSGEVESPLDEVEEMELAAELLAVSSEEELDQFLGKFFKRAGKAIKKGSLRTAWQGCSRASRRRRSRSSVARSARSFRFPASARRSAPRSAEPRASCSRWISKG